MKILVGLSGGVDSAVAALLLIRQGHQVSGAFMRNWDSTLGNDVLGNPDLLAPTCPQERDYADALKVAQKLGIELLRVDYIKEYWRDVFEPFLEQYRQGRTPNPDIYCNKFIKFHLFRQFAASQGFDAIATGHYAGRRQIDDLWFIQKARDLNKDQSYFLAQLSHPQIANTIFPLADLTKAEVRQLASQAGLAVASKKDSTGICFIGERDFAKFLQNYIDLRPGDIVDATSGRVLGRHQGVLYYTIGQRKGLGIGGIAGRENSSWFVCGKDIEKNIVYVADLDHQCYLDVSSLIVSDLNILTEINPNEELGAKFRYRQADQRVRLRIEGDKGVVTCVEPTRAPTPGQQAVFYRGDVVVAAGIIDWIEESWKR